MQQRYALLSSVFGKSCTPSLTLSSYRRERRWCCWRVQRGLNRPCSYKLLLQGQNIVPFITVDLSGLHQPRLLCTHPTIWWAGPYALAKENEEPSPTGWQNNRSFADPNFIHDRAFLTVQHDWLFRKLSMISWRPRTLQNSFRTLISLQSWPNEGWHRVFVGAVHITLWVYYWTASGLPRVIGTKCILSSDQPPPKTVRETHTCYVSLLNERHDFAKIKIPRTR
jgi:hypothetical protein